MIRAFLAFPAGILLALLAGCTSPPLPTRHIVISGSRSMAPLLIDIGNRFEEKHPGVRVNVQPTISARAGIDTRNGLADIGMLGRPLRPDESGLQPTMIGRDGVVFILNRNNPVKSLDEQQLLALLTRNYTNWREVGGVDRPVTVVGLAEGVGLRDIVLDHFALTPMRLQVEAPVSSTEQAILAVANNSDAIGYACLGRALKSADKLRLLTFGGVEPTIDNVRIGRYPLIRPLLLLTRDKPDELVKEFLEFARSDEVRELLANHGIAPPQDKTP